MRTLTIIGLILLVLGLEGLFYGGFSYIVDSRNDKAAGETISDAQRHSIDLPLYGGLLGTAIGGLILVLDRRKQRGMRD